MHQLCQNTSSSRQDMLVMFSVMYEKNDKAIVAKNARQQTPISILENRLCKVEDSYENPYETNRDAQSSLYDMMIKMKNAQERSLKAQRSTQFRRGNSYMWASFIIFWRL